MSLGSNNNAILFNNCQSLKNPIVTLVVSRDLIVSPEDTGFSLQLNCYPQTKPQPKIEGYPQAWFQYVITVHAAQVEASLQYWSYQDPVNKGHGYSAPDNGTSFATATSNKVPRGSVMRIELDTDSKDKVTGVYFGITPTDFNSAKRYFMGLPSDCRLPIYGFQVNLVGPGYDTHKCTFTSLDGILTYQTLDSLAVQTKNKCGGPPKASGGAQFISLETSNSVYGDVFAEGSWNLSQRVSV